MPELKDKLVLVTGAARGIGRSVAFEFAKRGARLILLDVLADKLDKAEEDFRKAGHTVHAYKCDVSSDDAVASVGAKIIKDVGVPDIIYNNAFWAPSGSVEDIDIPAIHRAFDISVLGYLRIVKAFVTDMIARKSGWIVNTASPNGITPTSEFASNGLPYNLCKAADISMSQAMAAGLKKYNIGVTVIFPGATLTEAIQELGGDSPTEHELATKEFFRTRGITSAAAAVEFVEGVRQGKFFVTTYPNFANILVEYAKNGLDPNANYDGIFV